MPISEPSPIDAAVQHHLMADRHVLADGERGARISVQHAESSWTLLPSPITIGSLSPRNTGAGPDDNILAQDHRTDDRNASSAM